MVFNISASRCLNRSVVFEFMIFAKLNVFGNSHKLVTTNTFQPTRLFCSKFNNKEEHNEQKETLVSEDSMGNFQSSEENFVRLILPDGKQCSMTFTNAKRIAESNQELVEVFNEHYKIPTYRLIPKRHCKKDIINKEPTFERKTKSEKIIKIKTAITDHDLSVKLRKVHELVTKGFLVQLDISATQPDRTIKTRTPAEVAEHIKKHAVFQKELSDCSIEIVSIFANKQRAKYTIRKSDVNKTEQEMKEIEN